MFIRIAIDQAVSLHDADDLRRLHVEVAGLDGRAVRSALDQNRLGRMVDGGDVELEVATLRRLAGDRDQDWAEEFANMLAYADTHGWMTDDGYVRAHCVRIPAVPLD